MAPRENLAHLAAMGDIPDADDRPIFIMAATWRSGSTLLQRLVVSSGEALVWGEPWNRTDLVGIMRRSLRPFDGSWPQPSTPASEVEPTVGIEDRWIANLFPPPGDLVEAHRSMFRRLLAEPAARADRPRWGAKFVRYGLDDARYLRFLFPDARFVFVIRDPVDAWGSYRAYGLQSYARWPDRPVATATHFGRLWRRRSIEFVEGSAEVGALVVRYEDLLPDSAVLDELEEYLDLTLDRSVLDTVVGASPTGSVNRLTRWRLRRSIGSAAERLGYERP